MKPQVAIGLSVIYLLICGRFAMCKIEEMSHFDNKLETHCKHRNTTEWVFSKSAGVFFTKTEITVAQYLGCIKSGDCENIENLARPSRYALCNINSTNSMEDHPMNCIGVEKAADFCKWINGRLPTPGEWMAEFTKGGKWKYPWGDEEPSCRTAVIGTNFKFDSYEYDASIFHVLEWVSDSISCGIGHTLPVCSKTDGNSTSGLCDMCGNVAEWVVIRSKYHEYVESYLAGGSYSFQHCGLNRLEQGVGGRLPEDGMPIIGFRCARDKIGYEFKVNKILGLFVSLVNFIGVYT